MKLVTMGVVIQFAVSCKQYGDLNPLLKKKYFPSYSLLMVFYKSQKYFLNFGFPEVSLNEVRVY